MAIVTIITVCYNECDTISRCINSVLSQGYEYIQYIVIDGSSTDGTVPILRRYEKDLSVLVIEGDSGIYSAMNKALKYSRGDWVYFLNADDYFYGNNVVTNAISLLSVNPKASILSGRVQFFNTPIHDGKVYDRSDFSYKNKLELYRKPIPQQCLFINRRLFERYSHFDERYRICADYEWLVRMLTLRVPVLFTCDYFCYFDYTGVSCTEIKQRKREKNLIIIRNSTLFELFRFFISAIKQRIT